MHLREHLGKVIKLRDKIMVPIPLDAGFYEGDTVSIIVIRDGEILIKKVMSEGEIIKKIREGVIARGFHGESVNDIIKGCKEWFKEL